MLPLPLSRKISAEKMMSSTVTRVPSEKRASGRRWNSTHERSSGVSIDSATRPYSVNGSSQERAIRLSNTWTRMPQAYLPLVMCGLRLSKPPTSPRTSSPPFGASGSAYGKCVNPGCSAGSPIMEIPCIGPEALESAAGRQSNAESTSEQNQTASPLESAFRQPLRFNTCFMNDSPCLPSVYSCTPSRNHGRCSPKEEAATANRTARPSD